MILGFGARYAVGPKTKDVSADLTPWLREVNRAQLPIVVANPLTYLPLAHNAPRDVADTLLCIPDAKEALRFVGVSSPDYNLAGLQGVAPLNLPTYSAFMHSHQRFLMLWEAGPFDWILPKLRETGAELRFYDARDQHILFLADFPQTFRHKWH